MTSASHQFSFSAKLAGEFASLWRRQAHVYCCDAMRCQVTAKDLIRRQEELQRVYCGTVCFMLTIPTRFSDLWNNPPLTCLHATHAHSPHVFIRQYVRHTQWNNAKIWNDTLWFDVHFLRPIRLSAQVTTDSCSTSDLIIYSNERWKAHIK